MLERLLDLMSEDWTVLRTARRRVHATRDRRRSRVALALALGASWRAIAHRTGIPVTTVRRWAKRFLNDIERSR